MRFRAIQDGFRRRLADMAPRDRRLLGAIGAATVACAAALAVFLVETSVDEKEGRNAAQAEVLRLVREKGPAYRRRVHEQEALEARLQREMPPLPSIVGEVLSELGRERQDFQELAPEAVGLPGQKRKPWTRLSVKFPLRKVPIMTVYRFLILLRDRFGDLPIAVTSLDLRVDRSETGLYNGEMIVSAYRFSEPRAPDRSGEGGGPAAPPADGAR
ncbi:MAG: hypothetical protein QME96_00735 [Myxococcota bacterium]|nr:hypothetical protein [Myxococcota bacterium]